MRLRLDEGHDELSVDGVAASGLRDRDGPDDVGDLHRPDPTAPLGERAREWVEWFGLTRLLMSAVAVAVVCAGAWFLVRTPPPPTEASLPVASSATGSQNEPEVTLPVATAAVPVSTVGRSRVTVHVAGAVILPGVYELGPGSRVDDAVRRAGGTTAEAALGRINLAALLVDGDQVYVPVVGEDIPLTNAGLATSDSTSSPTGPIEVNRASADELEALPGVGPATAAAIISERDRNGPFASLDDLERVPGIGPAKLAGLVGLVAT